MGKGDRSNQVAPAHRQVDVLYRQAYACIYPPPTSPQSDSDREMNYLICRRCVQQLLHLAKKSRIRLSPVMRRSICRGCHLILDPRTTGRLRLHKNGIVLFCESCGTRHRTPLQPNASYSPPYFERMLPDSKLPIIDTSNNKTPT